jgi:integrase
MVKRIMQCESTLQHAINNYIVRRKAAGFAANTIKNDASILWRFDWFLNSPDLEDITETDVMTFISQVGIDMQPSSLNQIQNKLSVFFKFCQEMGYAPMDWRPMGMTRKRKVLTKERRRIPLADFGKFLNCAENPRDRIVLAIGLYLFLRQSELVALKLKHLDMPERQVTVTIFKTKDSDVMPICSELHMELKRWLAYYKEQVGALDPEMYLCPPFSTRDLVLSPYQQMTRPTRITHRAMEKYGWPLSDQKGEGIHTLRRSGARALFDELDSQTIDGALRVVQSHLHHKSSVMTEKYLGITADRVKRDRLLRGEIMFPSQHIEEVAYEAHKGLALIT